MTPEEIITKAQRLDHIAAHAEMIHASLRYHDAWWEPRGIWRLVLGKYERRRIEGDGLNEALSEALVAVQVQNRNKARELRESVIVRPPDPFEEWGSADAGSGASR